MFLNHTKLAAFLFAFGCMTLSGSRCLAADGEFGLGLANRNGRVVVTYVKPSSAAFQIGVLAGDVLKEVNGVKLRTVEQAYAQKKGLPDNTAIPMVIGTPDGDWPVEGVFEKGVFKLKAKQPRPAKKGK